MKYTYNILLENVKQYYTNACAVIASSSLYVKLVNLFCSTRFKRSFSSSALIALFMTALLFPLNHTSAQFNSPGSRYFKISNSVPSAIASYEVGFIYKTGSLVGSTKFEICDNPLFTATCNIPTGVDVSNVVLASQSGETGFSIFSKNQNTIILTRPAAITTGVSSKVLFNQARNPSIVNSEFYLKISFYSSTDGSGTPIDRGATVSHTSENIDLTTIVPPILYFCVATAIPTDCSSASGSLIQLGSLSSTVESSGTSQLMAQTNADFGYALSVNGTTMTSGNNVVSALVSPTTSQIGTAQFGINLRDNANPNVGQEPIGVGIATPSAQYAIPNAYKFVSGDTIASSNDVSDYVKFTVSYLVNVPPDQKAGVYSTTLTYTIAATF